VTRAGLAALLACCVGCRAAHEAMVLQQLPQHRLSQAAMGRTLGETDAVFQGLPPAEGAPTSELRLASATTNADGSRTWCVTMSELRGCFQGRAEGLTTRLSTAKGATPSGTLTRAVWGLLDPASLVTSPSTVTAEELAALTDEEEASFTPRWTFTAGARSGAISSIDTPAFTFGGQLGVRCWASYYLLPGLALEVENMLQRERTVLTLAPQARLEVALWSDENERFLNLPALSFLMAMEPLFAFGHTTAVGARAVVGVHLGHLGRFITPFFFEVGYQSLTVDRLGASGLRVAIGVGL
jgi:hypothetical protein